jgi:hypothetical protein
MDHVQTSYFNHTSSQFQLDLQQCIIKAACIESRPSRPAYCLMLRSPAAPLAVYQPQEA